MKHIERHVTIRDDFGSAGAAEPVAFSFDGIDFEIDLNKRNRDTFIRHMKPYMDAGRPAQQRKAGVEDAAAIRRWAVSRGYQLSTRGRIPQHVITAYEGEAA